MIKLKTPMTTKCGLSAILVALIVLSSASPVRAFTLSNSPLFLTTSAKPLTMIVMSKDQQLFYKAYTDWGDLDGDNVPETTYKHSFNYYGYFDATTCYDYNSLTTRFEPKAKSTTKYCDAVNGDWSGNFLNWASMARIDVVRKVLYGGKRKTDSATETVLERSPLPTDAHSFAKFYANSAELVKLTPYSSTDTAAGITLCNTTYISASGSSGQSENVTEAPMIRVVKGDFRYWAANERWQCTWDNERGDNTNGTHTDPNSGTDGLTAQGGPTYRAQVQVCVNANDAGGNSLLESNCKQYPNGNYKPTGTLHTYGEDGRMLFGLLTGSYQKNKSGGILRKNVTSFANEIDANTGAFATLSPPGIVGTIDRFRITRYFYGTGNSDGLYNTTDSCSWGLNSFTDGNCSNWGNPISEMFLEAVRYYGGLSATSGFAAPNDGNYISGLSTATWSSPLSNTNWCASSNIVLLNASEISYDADSLSMSGLPGSPNATTWTNTIGSASLSGTPVENISGNSFFVGENGTDNNQLCTAKTVTNLGDVRGTCPGSPRLSGSYNVAGIAYWAHTNDVNTSVNGGASDTKGQRINTYSVQLSPNTPNVVIPVPNSTQTITLLPACRNSDVGGNCAIVDFKILSQDTAAGTGTLYVNWEDSEQGGDYDQDMKGTISYAINTVTNQITVTTDVDAESTIYDMGFGYVISGTTNDGFHVHSGIEGYTFTDPSGDPDCNPACNVGDAPTSRAFTIGSSSAGQLKDPLYYAAKWGGFSDSDASGDPGYSYPDKTSEWDRRVNQTGASGSDSTPDNYFLVSNPAGLVTSLARAFEEILSDTGTASAVAINTASLSTESYVYQAIFTSNTWSGQLLAKRIDPVTGEVATTKTWDSALKLESQDWDTGRTVLTWNPDSAATRKGVPFRWSNIGNTNQTYLNSGSYGQERLNFLRGDNTNEAATTNPSFRARSDINLGGHFKLGDIVNSAPIHVGAPPFLYPDTLEDATGATKKYSSFRNAQKNRTPIVYVGANDGMLHGFNACAVTSQPGCSDATQHGKEVIAYVPAATYPNLSALSNPNYGSSHKYFVDLSPTAGDVFGDFSATVSSCTAGCWRTLMIGGMRAGGKAYFALDITDPSAFSEDTSQATNQVLWEYTHADLGNTFSDVTIAKMHTASGTRWAAIFGNGYNSTNGYASLFIVDAITGTLIKKIDVDTAGSNGLSTPAVVDTDGNYIADYIYAGDLKGNMWKFDVTDNNEVQWGSYYRTGSTPKPLFKAVDGANVAQPITSRPEVGKHPDSLAGYMVYFGTGKYVEVGDNNPGATPSPTHTFYGLWDKDTNGNGGTPIVRADLLAQTITEGTYRTVTNNPIYWDGETYAGTPSFTGTHKGWRDDLLTTTAGDLGEMVVSNPILRSTRVIFTTLIPDTQQCTSGGSSWLMELNYQNGGRLAIDVFDINNDGVFNSDDRGGESTPISGVRTGIGISPTPTIIDDPAKGRELKIVTGSSGAISSVSNNPGPLSSATGRRSWRQIK